MAGKRDRLTARRRALGFTQESLAERLGVHPTTVKRWENGSSAGGPHPYARVQLARYLQVSAEELEELLAGGVGEKNARGEPEPAVVTTGAINLDDEERLVLAARDPGRRRDSEDFPKTSGRLTGLVSMSANWPSRTSRRMPSTKPAPWRGRSSPSLVAPVQHGCWRASTGCTHGWRGRGRTSPP